MTILYMLLLYVDNEHLRWKVLVSRRLPTEKTT